MYALSYMISKLLIQDKKNYTVLRFHEVVSKTNTFRTVISENRWEPNWP